MITTEEFTARVREAMKLPEAELAAALIEDGWKETAPGSWAGGDNNFSDVPPRFALALAKLEDEDGVASLQGLANAIADVMNQIAAEQGRLHKRRWSRWDPFDTAMERLIPPGRVLVEITRDVFARGTEGAALELLTIIATTPAATFLVITRDLTRVRRLLAELDNPLQNLLLGTIVEGQHLLTPAMEAIDDLQVGGRVLLFDPRETIGLGKIRHALPDWIIVRGANHPLHPGWVSTLRAEATFLKIPFTFDGWGSWGEVPPTHAAAKVLTGDGALFPDARHGVPDAAVAVARIGAKRSGNLLDGVAYDERPVLAR